MNLNLNNKVFFLFGCISGIGRSLVGELLEEGAKVYLFTQSEDYRLFDIDNVEVIKSNYSSFEDVTKSFNANLKDVKPDGLISFVGSGKSSKVFPR